MIFSTAITIYLVFRSKVIAVHIIQQFVYIQKYLFSQLLLNLTIGHLYFTIHYVRILLLFYFFTYDIMIIHSRNKNYANVKRKLLY